VSDKTKDEISFWISNGLIVIGALMALTSFIVYLWK
jgi:hypothetical protein